MERSAESPGPASVATMGPRVIRTARMNASASFHDSQVSIPDPSFRFYSSQPPPSFDFSSDARCPPAAPREWASPATISHAAAAAAAAVDSSPAARRSTRKRKAPELLSASPDDHRPRKRREESSSSSKPPPAKKAPASAKKRAPGRLKTDPDEEDASTDAKTCCICMTDPELEDLATINGCDHHFCFGCIEKWADRENTCPLCKTRFVKIDRVHKPKRQKGGRAPKTSVKVKNKSQRSEMTHGLALESLFGEMSRSGIAIESFFARLGGHRSFNTHISSIVVGGAPPPRADSSASAAPGEEPSSASVTVGSSAGTSFRFARAPPQVAAQLQAAGVPSFAVHRGFFTNFSDGEDTDEDDEPDDGFDGFMAAMRGSRAFSFSSLPTVSMHALPPLPPPPPPARSFASNMHDITAGGSAENALEIEDSDDDDEVEIVGTRRSPYGQGM